MKFHLPPIVKRQGYCIQSLCVVLCMINIPRMLCCNYNLYISSSNRVCRDKLCTEETHGITILRQHEEVCFSHPDSSLTKIRLYSLEHIHRYRDLYYTCSYTANITSQERCYLSDGCDSDTCVPQKYYPDNFAPLYPEDGLTYFTGCVKQGDCSGNCLMFMATRCLWTQVRVSPNKCYKVLKYHSTIWKASLDVVDKNNSVTRYILTSNNPITSGSFYLHAISVDTLWGMPTPPDNLLVVRSGEAIPIIPSLPGYPELGKVGSMQRDLIIKSRYIFPIHMVSCKSSSCQSECQFPTDPLNRIIDDYHTGKLRKKSMYQVPGTIGTPRFQYTEQTQQGGLQVITQFQKDISLIVNTARCNIKIQYIYGCTGCDDLTRIGVQSYNVSVYGSLYLSSNCTGLPDYLTCQDLPYEILVPSSLDICNISLYSQRALDTTPVQSIMLHIPKLFVGGLQSLELLTLTDTKSSGVDTLASTLSHPKFFESAMYAGLLTSIIPIAIRGLIAIKALDITQRIIPCQKRSPSS